MPTRVTTKPTRTSRSCRPALGEALGAERGGQQPVVVAVRITPAPAVSQPRTTWRSAETTNDTPVSGSHGTS
jgi:hypothetical protein